ncbi:glycosyl transferase [Micromonospora sonchi]|uniref:Glycosyl transferase n=1 Tax=Micromonospora sonchi TaxID=1763543 RepID=A0A917U249_9ACTN|nr:nucleotide disphospho-sugar-binding domain-containing protein [Micromonospora sonchi]GGM52517.1 glycosyl transferase [Micromonospora sonchi]
MRVLFVSSPGIGHLFPLVQLAWGFRTAGHDVVIALAEHTQKAAAAGLEVVDVAPDFSAVKVFEQVAKDNPRFAETVATRPAIDLEEWGVQIAAVNRPLVDRTIALADDFKPDLVVYEQGATVGLLAAARAGVPAVQRNQSAWRTRGMHASIASFLTDLMEKHQVTLPKPSVTIESFPPSLLLEAEPEGWFMRWVPYGGGTVLGDRLPAPPTRPEVAITMGTIELQAFGIGAVAPIIAAAAEVDADFVLALGDLDITPLGKLPPNMRAVGWTPLHTLLRTCTAVVHHGGGGTVMTAIDAGLPQLLAPDPRDQFQHTAREAVSRRGIGLVSTADKVDADLLRRLIGDESMRAAAREVREEMRALPTPAETVRRLVERVVTEPAHAVRRPVRRTA